jgi:hypothetical protein
LHGDTDDSVSDEIADGLEKGNSEDSTAEPAGNANSGNAVVQSAHNLTSSLQKQKQVDVVIGDAGEPITAAMLIVDKPNETTLVRAAQNDEWQLLADQMAEDSVVFVFTTTQVLLNISKVIETFDGFRCANAYLLSKPDKLEITKCNVLAIYERGEGVSVEGVPNWKADDAPVSIVEQFLQGVGGRSVHFFGDAPPKGWEILTIKQK